MKNRYLCMIMKKKIMFAFALLCVFCRSIAGCSGDNPEQSAAPEHIAGLEKVITAAGLPERFVVTKACSCRLTRMPMCLTG